MSKEQYDFMYDRIKKAYENKDITYSNYIECMEYLNDKYREGKR